MKRSKLTEEQIAYALTPGRERDVAGRCVPAARRERSHVLRLEEEVRASGRERAPAAPVTRGGEHPAETAGRGPLARQAHAERGFAKKSLRPSRRRELAAWFQGTYGVSCVRACRLAQFSRAAWYRKSRAKDQTAPRMRICELAHARPRFGVLRIWVLLRREGWPVNRKRVRHLYRLDGLQLRMRVRRRKHVALIVGLLRSPRRRGNAGAWTSSTTRWPMGARSAS